MEMKLNSKSKLAYSLLGEGEPLVCLSGFGCDHYNFLDLIPELKNHFQLILIDNRGMGGSFRPEKNYTLRDLAKDTLELLDELNLLNFHVMGISMGGFVAQLIAEMVPSRLKSLYLLCTSGTGQDFSPIPLLSKEHLTEFYQQDQKVMIPKAVELTTHPESNQQIKDHIINTRLDHPVELDQVLLQRDAVAHFFAEENIEYARLPKKTLILSGREDRFVPIKNSKILQEKINGSSMMLVNNSDHFFFMEKAKDVSKLVIEYHEKNRGVNI